MISLSSLVLSFLLIFIAEIGDKSQLVILSLATKFKVEQEKNNIKNHKDYNAKDKGVIKVTWKIIFGASVAFASLNLLAVKVKIN